MPRWLGGWLNDLVTGLRTIVRSPRFSALVIFTLTLSRRLGAALLSPLHALVLRLLDVPGVQRIVMVTIVDQRDTRGLIPCSVERAPTDLWIQASPDQRQRFQWPFFREGMTFGAGGLVVRKEIGGPDAGRMEPDG